MKFYAVLSTSSLSNSLITDYNIAKGNSPALKTSAVGPGLPGDTRKKKMVEISNHNLIKNRQQKFSECFV